VILELSNEQAIALQLFIERYNRGHSVLLKQVQDRIEHEDKQEQKFDQMHDLAEHFAADNSYSDFEGMADPAEVLKVCRDPESGKYVWDDIKLDRPEQSDINRSLLLHYLYTRADTYQVSDLSYKDACNFWELLMIATQSRRFSKVTDDQIKLLEQGTEE